LIARLRIHLHGPWIVAVIVVLMALHLLRLDRFAATSGAWGLLGSAAICFSIGCVCRTSWHIARGRGPS
jgi:uncharacterized membrane protein